MDVGAKKKGIWVRDKPIVCLGVKTETAHYNETATTGVKSSTA